MNFLLRRDQPPASNGDSLFPGPDDVDRAARAHARVRRVEPTPREPTPAPARTTSAGGETRKTWHTLTFVVKVSVRRDVEEERQTPLRGLCTAMQAADQRPRPEITMSSLVGDVTVETTNNAFYDLITYAFVNDDHAQQFPRTVFGSTPAISGNVWSGGRTTSRVPTRIRTIADDKIEVSWLAATFPNHTRKTVYRCTNLNSGLVSIAGNHPVVAWIEAKRHERLHELYAHNDRAFEEALADERSADYENPRDPRDRAAVQMPKEKFEAAARAICDNNAVNLTLGTLMQHLTLVIRRAVPAVGRRKDEDEEVLMLGDRALSAGLVTEENYLTFQINVSVLELR